MGFLRRWVKDRLDDLKRRLEAYERVREAARELSKLFGKQMMISEGERAIEPTFAPSRDLSAASLAEALARVLAAREVVEELPEARVKPMVTIEEYAQGAGMKMLKQDALEKVLEGLTTLEEAARAV